MITSGRTGGVLRIGLDDGRANILTTDVLAELNRLLDQAAADDGVRSIVIAGREGMLTGGLDLKAFLAGGETTAALRREAGRFLHDLTAFPKPVAVAATGHAVAAGAMMLMAADWRIGVTGDFRIGLNEVADGIPLPDLPLILAEFRLDRRHLARATALAEIYGPEGAVEAGYLDECCPPAELDGRIEAAVERFSRLQAASFADTKARLRAGMLQRIRAGLNE